MKKVKLVFTPQPKEEETKVKLVFTPYEEERECKFVLVRKEDKNAHTD